MNREEFFGKVAALDAKHLQKALWNLYWRGNASMRERIEAELELDPAARAGRPGPTVDANAVLARVRDFASLARAGAYLGGDRRVSPKERSGWRITFRRLAGEAREALAAKDPDPGIAAMELLVDLACEARRYDYFRSDDPVEAARFVVSDAAEQVWDRLRTVHGFDRFSARATTHLVRWESEYGWTRRGDGATAEKEVSLAGILARKLVAPDMWVTVADRYLEVLDEAGTARDVERARRTGDLAEWHGLLLDRLPDYDADDRLDRLARHPALGGPELTFFKAQLARRRGEIDRARELVRECLGRLPGHPAFLAVAIEIDAPMPERAAQIIASRQRAAPARD